MNAIDLGNEEVKRRVLEIAHAMKEPDEIWEFWDSDKHKSFRLYYARFQGMETHPYVICRIEGNGWAPDKTGFAADKEILEMRQGSLIYRRPD